MAEQKICVADASKRYSHNRFQFVVTVCMLLFLTVVSFVRDVKRLNVVDFPVGFDGYYYQIQTQSLLHNHNLYFPSRTPLYFTVIALLVKAGISGISAAKFLACISSAFCGLAIASLLWNWSRRPSAAILGCCIAELAPLHLYQIVEFNKEIFACSFLLIALACSTSAGNPNARHRKTLKVSATVFVIIAVFSHPLAGPFVALAYIVDQIFQKIGNRKQLVFLFLFALLAVPLILDGSHLIHASSYRHLTHLLPSCPFVEIGRTEKLGGALAAIAIFVLGAVHPTKMREPSFRYGMIASLLMCVLVANPWLNYQGGTQQIPGRLGNLSYIFAAILIGLSVPALRWGGLTLASLATLLIIGIPEEPPRGISEEFLANRRDLLVDVNLHAERVSHLPCFIASHGDQFLLTFMLNKPAEMRQSPGGGHKCYVLIRSATVFEESKDVIRITENRNVSNWLIEEDNLRVLLDRESPSRRWSLWMSNPVLRLPANRTLTPL